MSETISEIRKRAWNTRRQKYGKRGHHGTYSRGPGACGDCARMREWLIRLHIDGVLSEGQAVKATGLDRISVREHSDEMVNSGDYIPIHRVEDAD